MNIIDWGIIGIIGLCVLLGLYQGFLSSALRLVAVIVSWIVARIGYVALATSLMDGTGLMPLFNTYAEASEKLGGMEIANLPIAQMTPDAISQAVEKVALPSPVASQLASMLTSQGYASEGLSTLGEYVNQWIASSVLYVLSFVAIFAATYLVLSIVIGIVAYVTKLPVLRQLDSLAGGVFGLLRGAVVVVVLFAGVSLLLSVVPLENLGELMANSRFAPMLRDGNLLLRSLFE